MAQSRSRSEHLPGVQNATIRLKARSEELRTLTSRNPGRCGHPEKESKEDGSAYVDYSDKGGFLRELPKPIQIGTWGRSCVHL